MLEVIGCCTQRCPSRWALAASIMRVAAPGGARKVLPSNASAIATSSQARLKSASSALKPLKRRLCGLKRPKRCRQRKTRRLHQQSSGLEGAAASRAPRASPAGIRDHRASFGAIDQIPPLEILFIVVDFEHSISNFVVLFRPLRRAPIVAVPLMQRELENLFS